MGLNIHCPHVVLGDFNATPCRLGPIKDLINTGQWTDVGQRVDWWGGVPNEWACHGRSKARISRSDGIVIDAEMLAAVHAFEVGKHIDIPTRRVLRLEIARSAFG